MNTDYPTSHFNYDNDFLHQFNIFKKNELTGIGTSNPTHKLEVNGTLAFSDNTNIEGNINLLNKYPNHINLLEYNVNSHVITPLKLMNKEGTINSNKYEWSQENNNLMLKFYNKRDNTPIPFHSIEYTIKNTPEDKKIFFYSKYNIKLTHLYIYTKNNDIFESYTDFSSLFKITLNSIDYNVTSISEFYYELTSPIMLNKNTNNIFELSGITTYPYNITLLGQYIFNEGVLWNSNTDNINIFSNIGIGTSIAQSTLSIHGSSIIENLNIQKTLILGHSNNITSNNITSNNITSNNITSNINTIYSDKFIINPNQKNVGIGVGKSEDYLNISNDFIVDHNNNIFYTSHNSNINHINMYSPNNIISYKNNPLFILNNSNNNFNIKSRDIHISKSIKQNTTSSSCITQFLNNVNINDFNYNYNNIFQTNGTFNINGNITINESLKSLGESTIYMKNYIIPTVQNKSHTHSKNVIYSNNLASKNLITYSFNPKQNNILPDKTSEIIYHPIKNKFYSKNNNYKLFFSTQFEQEKYKFDYNFYSHADLLYTSNKIINTNRINATHKLILPKKYTYSSSVTNRNNIGCIRFNVFSINPEIYNGQKWNKIKYSNEDAELNYCMFDDSNLLQPLFKSNIQAYLYDSLIKPLSFSVSINPNIHLEIIFKLKNENTFTKIITANELKIESFQISSIFYDTLIITSTNLITNNNKIYTFYFNFYDPIQDFLNKYSLVTINRYQNSNNIFDIKPTTNLTNKYYNITQNSIQINTTEPAINTISNNLQYEYKGVSSKKNFTQSFLKKNMMLNSYYDRNDMSFYLGYPIKSYNIELIFNNDTIQGGYYSATTAVSISPVFEFQLPNITYNFETRKMYITNITNKTNENINELVYNNNDFGCLFEHIICKIKYNS